MTIFYTANRQKKIVCADTPVNGGAEGDIYKIPGNDTLCVKIFKSEKLQNDRDALEYKFQVMVRNPPPETTQDGFPTYTWPLDLIYDDDNQFVGFLMLFISGVPLESFIADSNFLASYHLDHPDNKILITWQHLYVIARNLAVTVSTIHKAGHRIGDLKPANILVKNTRITFVDCNSFLIFNPVTKSYIKTHKQESTHYIPPEHTILDENTLNKLDWIYSDRWILAVIIFRVLMCGIHPFHSRLSGVFINSSDGSIDGNVLLGAYPYSGNQRNICTISRHSPDFHAIIPPPLQELFHRCFDKNKGYQNLLERPTAQDWINAMDSLTWWKPPG